MMNACICAQCTTRILKGFSPRAGSFFEERSGGGVNKKVSAFDVQEGDEITISRVAVPELYETEGNIDAAQLRDLMDSGVLGSGVS